MPNQAQGSCTNQFNYFNEVNESQWRVETLQEIARQQREVANSVYQDNIRLKQQVEKKNNYIARLKQTIEALNFTSNQNEALYAEKAQLQTEIQESASYINSLEHKFFKSIQTSLRLLANLRECEKEKLAIEIIKDD